jgi:hypothetical protein
MKKIINIDASSLSSLNCYRRYWNKFVLGIRGSEVIYNDTEFGSAWHIFRQTLAISQDIPSSIASANKYFATRRSQGMVFRDKKEHLNEEYLTQLCLKYLREFPDISKSWGKYERLRSPVDNSVLVEQTFNIPFFESDTCIINLQGTIDEKILHPAGYLIIADDKTTSKWDTKGFLKAFETKPQLKFYRLALSLLAEQEGGDWFKELLTRRVGCRINGVFLKSDINKVSFEHSDIFFFSEEDLSFFRKMLRMLCERILYDIENYYSDTQVPEGMINESCSSSYCEFINACPKGDEVYKKMLATMNVRTYEPLNFRKL